ncbi:MAG: LEA type 2 family protein [Bacteroidetes bacterium]|nr:LEA type 2 family protein [Bacteroidota bacterium]
MKNFFFPIIIALLCVTSISCKSVQHTKNLKDCSYNVVGITSISAGSVDIDGKTSFKDFNANDVASLSKLLMNKQLPISFTANIAVFNPNDKPAALQSLDWILFVKNQEMARGFLPNTITINPREKIIVEIPVNTDLSKLLSAYTMQELSAMIFSFSSKKAFKDDVKLKIRPAVQVGKKYIKAPAYVTVPIPAK